MSIGDIPSSTPCDRCGESASWLHDDAALCDECMTELDRNDDD